MLKVEAAISNSNLSKGGACDVLWWANPPGELADDRRRPEGCSLGPPIDAAHFFTPPLTARSALKSVPEIDHVHVATRPIAGPREGPRDAARSTLELEATVQ